MNFLQPIGKLLCIVGLLGLLDGHWLVLQGIAWTSMALKAEPAASVETLGQRVAKGFAGTQPCAFCLRIAAGSSNERDRKRDGDAVATAAGLVLAPIQGGRLCLSPPPPLLNPIECLDRRAAARIDELVLPPPRSLPACA